MILEYMDLLTMGVTADQLDVSLGIPDEVRGRALAYLVVMLDGADSARVEVDVLELAELMSQLGAIDVYVLADHAASALLDAREKAFWLAKTNGADDILDLVVPRASLPQLMTAVAALGADTGSWIAGAGHAGDGNVHLAIFQHDADVRRALVRDLVDTTLSLGGAISAEHGIGLDKRDHFLAREDPVKIALMRRIKAAFDPDGILNPGKLI